ncbi:MAG: trypsin-like peptidase domain-containing protein [Ectothiorhodospiraceae bacterium]|nr:trypsin-like peptidase domain-containing protein [Chromatiales bacterium]MCP5157654.1 trypsin-like peptidase domain-containing protein [Ectothiorhodospiraceae bacterium]
MPRVRWNTTLALIAGTVVGAAVALARPPASVEMDANEMLDASVSVRTLTHVRIDPVGDSVWESTTGSGFLVSTTPCEVWTNHHVVEDAAMVQVFPRGTADGEGIRARVVRSSPRADLALLELERCDHMRAARLGNSSAVRQGQEIFAVGNPLGHNPDSISRGIVSHTQRYLGGALPYLQTDAAINPGNSGGALFNRSAEVIGINTAIATTEDGGNAGIGYALPIDLARQIAAELRGGQPSWGDAGIEGLLSGLSAGEAAVLGVPGARGAVILVSEPYSGPAAGALELHDVIYRIQGSPVATPEQALRVVTSYPAGSEVRFDLLRDGRPTQVRLTLGEGWAGDEARLPDDYEGHLGMTLEMWTDESDGRARFDSPVITHVQSQGPAHLAQISSSQRTMALRGADVITYQLDVKTVVGAFHDGRYRSIRDVESLERLAAEAAGAGVALLLEIELWTRSDPLDADSELTHVDTAFFRVEPTQSLARRELRSVPATMIGHAAIDADDTATTTIALRPPDAARHRR